MQQSITDSHLYDLLHSNFSKITRGKTTAINITIMDICQDYFECRCVAHCGFSSIILDGTCADWTQLSILSDELLSNYCTGTFANQWKKRIITNIK